MGKTVILGASNNPERFSFNAAVMLAGYGYYFVPVGLKKKDLKPRRIIFNPGTENPELSGLAQQSAIETIEDCTLIMLSGSTY